MRQNNEDNFFCDASRKLFMVADGLGGHSAGEVASEMAVKHISTGELKNVDDLVERITEANVSVYSEAQNLKNDMATTISSLFIYDGTAHIGHVGDSRIYLIREENVYCITDDHTPVMESLKAGIITPEQAKHHPLRHMLSRTIGTQPQVDIDVITVELEEKDAFVLCTDGLSNMLEEKDIYTVYRNSKDSSDAVKNMVDLANHRGGADNITVVVAVVEESDLVKPETTE